MNERHVALRDRHTKTQHVALRESHYSLVESFCRSSRDERSRIRVAHGDYAVIGRGDDRILLHTTDSQILRSRDPKLSLSRCHSGLCGLNLRSRTLILGKSIVDFLGCYETWLLIRCLLQPDVVCMHRPIGGLVTSYFAL